MNTDLFLIKRFKKIRNTFKFFASIMYLTKKVFML